MVDDWLLGKDPPDWVLFYKPQVILAYIHCTHLVPILINLLFMLTLTNMPFHFRIINCHIVVDLKDGIDRDHKHPTETIHML